MKYKLVFTLLAVVAGMHHMAALPENKVSADSAVAVSADTLIGRAKLRTGFKELDMGLFAKDEEKQQEVWIYNDGDGPLVVTSVRSDCGCTAADYPHDPIAPGDSAAMKVRFSARGRQPGTFRKMLRIRSNAGNRLEVMFVKGIVKRPLRRED